MRWPPSKQAAPRSPSLQAPTPWHSGSGGRRARCFGGSTGPLRAWGRLGTWCVAWPRAGTGSLPSSSVSLTRYRCASCGNLTRFDVTTTRRVRSFHHYTVGGELTVEDAEVLEERVDEVLCRWCGTGSSVELVSHEAS